MVDAQGNRSVQPGEYELYVGGNLPSAEKGVLLQFQIEGSSRISQ